MTEEQTPAPVPDESAAAAAPQAPAELPALHITAEHVRDGEYIGPDVSAWMGHIEIAADLGTVRFAGAIAATGRIRAFSGAGIEAGESIKAGGSIEAGESIKAGGSIACKFLSVRLRIFAGLVLWRLPRPGEDEIRCELRNGTIAFGKHVPPTGEAMP